MNPDNSSRSPAEDEKDVDLSYPDDSSGTNSDYAASSSSFQTGSKSQGGDETLVQGETTAVNTSKCMVYFALLCAAAAVSAVTYVFLTKEEQNALRIEFEAYSREILKQATANSNSMFEEIFDTSKAITSHALESGMSWPNVTLPHFDVRSTNQFSKVELVGFAPFVSFQDKDGWEAYSVENQEWIEQDYFYRGWDETPQAINDRIHSYIDDGEDPWFDRRRNLKTYNYSDPETFEYEIPLWQVSPPPLDTSIVNMDLATHPVFAHLLWDVRVKKVKQYSRAIDLSFLMGGAAADGHPRGVVFEPVFDDFHEDAEVVGFMLATLNWDNIFENVLFDSVAPVLVEIEGNCSAGFSYALTGDEVIFLGQGIDWHEERFSGFSQSAPILAPMNSREGYLLLFIPIDQPMPHTTNPIVPTS